MNGWVYDVGGWDFDIQFLRDGLGTRGIVVRGRPKDRTGLTAH